MLKRLAVFVRSLLVGGAATIVDLGALFVFVTLLGVAPRVASVPALLLSAIVVFAGNRHFAFRATDGDAVRQAMRFAVVHAGTLLLSAALFEIAMRIAPASLPYWAIRLAIGNVVYLGWSFPMMRRAFAVRPVLAEACARPSPRGMRSDTDR